MITVALWTVFAIAFGCSLALVVIGARETFARKSRYVLPAHRALGVLGVVLGSLILWRLAQAVMQ